MKISNLKKEVQNYWNRASCGTEFIKQKKHTLDYFEDIEEFRYKIEPEIYSFAQFTRFKDKKVLEVGVGAGTDFLQWVRVGAKAYGIDLTQEAIENVKHRLHLYNLKAQDLRVADAENLPYQDNNFDLVYSWGVIHHSPDTKKCLKEIVRVTKPGAKIKIMIYNRHSLFAFYRWLLAACFKGKPFRNFSKVLFYDQESLGTKAYTFREAKKLLNNLPIKILNIKATVSSHDLLYYKSKPVRFLAYMAACLFGWNGVGWFMTLELEKIRNKLYDINR
jgi:ubiquinone/menaquinone biosynthesis C-methylase UbiE